MDDQSRTSRPHYVTPLRALFPTLFLLISSVQNSWAQLPAPTPTLRKVALVIANKQYWHVNSLTNTINDASLIGQSLQQDGFSLVGGGVRTNLAYDDFTKTLQLFANNAKNADVAIVYYAGHGVQVDGVNYLLPVDLTFPKDATELRKEAIDAARILHTFDDANVRLKLLILDACRDNPLLTPTRSLGSARGLATMSRSLAAMSVPSGSAIWYATQQGNTAKDSTPGRPNNGPFAAAIAAYITRPGESFSSVFNKAGIAVLQATNQTQQPWLEATPMAVDFIFVDPATNGRSVFRPYALPDNGDDSGHGENRAIRLFGSGLQRPIAPFTFGEDYTEVNRSLDSSFQITRYEDLPRAAEYGSDDVRYFWQPLISLPSILSAIQPPSGFSASQCVDPQSYVAFFFKNRKLFHLSLRFMKTSLCAPYDWFFKDLLGGISQTLVAHRPDGDTKLIAHPINDWYILEIIQSGVADDDASVFH